MGNLTIGGVGKTPHVEYLIRLLKQSENLAVLSRGYKRKTSGFKLADRNSTIEDIGDEPLQYKNKFSKIAVAVDEKRVRGIQLIKNKIKDTSCIILDDAFQHRSLKSNMNILITDYNNLYCNDFVLPSGRLREFKSGYKRAQIIIVSKCDKNITEVIKKDIINNINPLQHQKIYFSAIKYGELTPCNDTAKQVSINFIKHQNALILTGIANPTPFINEVKSQFKTIEHLNFPDHHKFEKADISKIIKAFNFNNQNNKIIITTEKDFMRLSLPKILLELEEIPLFYIPIEIYFLENGKKEFNKQINNYVTTTKRN